ncbi:MAG TPA: hypothetical protein PK926_17900, partial [Spirochaetota bacterium]|nr:hypothetical protein [Spirochaetota bacterium]HPI90554.1 hypothetical protein [Spirochaetota bacterium]HPR50098.1 hypothetical protein [Spirochaetota bacterium]
DNKMCYETVAPKNNLLPWIEQLNNKKIIALSPKTCHHFHNQFPDYSFPADEMLCAALIPAPIVHIVLPKQLTI